MSNVQSTSSLNQPARHHEWLWYLAATTLPLCSVSFLRIPLAGQDLSLTAIITVFILFLSLTRLKHFWSFVSAHQLTNLAILSILFLGFHVISWFVGTQDSEATKYLLRVFWGVLSFWLLLFTTPHQFSFYRNFILILLISTSFLALALFIRYRFIFHIDFLGAEWSTYTRIGKNHLAWFLGMTLPYAWHWQHNNHHKTKWLFLFISTTLVSNIIYSQSRATWLSSLVFMAVSFYFVYQRNKKLVIKQSLVMIVIIISFVGFISLTSDINEYKVRVQTIFNPKALPLNPTTLKLGINSYADRTKLLKQTLTGITQAPFLGVGLGNRFHHVDQETHNDLLAIALEAGIPTALIALALIIILFAKISQHAQNHFISQCSLGALSVLITQSLFINMYFAQHFWLFLGIILLPSFFTLKPFDNQATTP